MVYRKYFTSLTTFYMQTNTKKLENVFWKIFYFNKWSIKIKYFLKNIFPFLVVCCLHVKCRQTYKIFSVDYKSFIQSCKIFYLKKFVKIFSKNTYWLLPCHLMARLLVWGHLSGDWYRWSDGWRLCTSDLCRHSVGWRRHTDHQCWWSRG